MPSPTRNENEVKQVLKSLGVKTYRDGLLAVVSTPSGEIEIERSHSYYWRVNGLVPLSKAIKLYADKVGRDKIRVAGHCGCPPPEAPYVTWIAPDGKHVISMQNKIDSEGYVNRGREAFDKGEEPSLMAEIGAKILKENYFSDNPAMDYNAKGYVNAYHIDSDEALRIFVDELKRP